MWLDGSWGRWATHLEAQPSQDGWQECLLGASVRGIMPPCSLCNRLLAFEKPLCFLSRGSRSIAQDPWTLDCQESPQRPSVP